MLIRSVIFFLLKFYDKLPLSLGPFIVSAGGNAPVFVDQAQLAGFGSPLRNAAVLPPSQVVLPAQVNAGEHSLFQTADGRIFALSTGANAIQPGILTLIDK